jgi:hypothetical protein
MVNGQAIPQPFFMVFAHLQNKLPANPLSLSGQGIGRANLMNRFTVKNSPIRWTNLKGGLQTIAGLVDRFHC